MKNVPHASTIISLIYTQVCMHLDITYVVGVLERYLSDPSQKHWVVVKRIMRYLQVTKNYMLTYKRSNDLRVSGYSNSNFAGCLDDHKSTSGQVFVMAREAMSWKSVKQSLTITSNMEAKYVTCYEAT